MKPLLLFLFMTCAGLIGPGETWASEASGEFTPYFFTPEKNGLEISNVSFPYTFLDKGRGIQIGPVQFTDRSLSASLQSAAGGGSGYQLQFNLPLHLIPQGQLVAETEKGEALWENTPNAKTLSSLLKGNKTEYSVALTRAEINEAFGQNRPLRLCWQALDQKLHKVCAGPQAFTGGENVALRNLAFQKKPTIRFNGKLAPPRGVVPNESERLRFQVRLIGGATYQFVTEPAHPQFVDVTWDKKAGEYVFHGYGPKPYGEVTSSDLEIDVNPLMDEPLYPKTPQLWTARYSDKTTFIYFSGTSGGYFRYPIFRDRVPPAELRLYSPKQRTLRTYSRTPRLTILNPNQVTYNLLEAERLEDGPSSKNADREPILKEQRWELQEVEKNEVQGFSAQITAGEQTYTAEVPVFRAYKYELSAMLGGAAQQNSLAFAAEARGAIWFETLLGCRQWLLCHQRWGARTRYFQSQSVIAIAGASDSEESELTTASLQGDLYYRLNRGVWGADEVIGLIAGYQKINFSVNELSSSQLGVGFIWGRPLPEIFEPLFDFFPLMDYAKWVHMDFTYYPVSLDDNVEFTNSAANWTLNFQGRVEWSERVYGEVGFGLYNYDIVETIQQVQFKTHAAFGTMGLGIRF